MVFHHEACYQKESAPVFPTETLALVPSYSPGSSGRDLGLCSLAGKRDAAFASPQPRSDVILRHQAVEVRAGAVVARSQIRDIELGSLAVPQLRVLHHAGSRSHGRAGAADAGRWAASENAPSEAWKERGDGF